MTSKKKSGRLGKVSHVSKYAVRRKFVDGFIAIMRYAILISLGFVIITPLVSTLKEAITSQNALGQRNSVWVPSAVSWQSFTEAVLILDYWKALAYSLVNTTVLAFLQTFCAALAAYSFARLKFKGAGFLFGLVIFTIIVPPQSIMLAQYITFRNFDVFNIFQAVTGSHLNLIGAPVSIYILAATGMGVKGGLYIYILRQSFRQFPISIEEASYVDGAGFLKTFLRIVLPGVSSSLLTVGVLSFVWNYADTYYISLLSSNKLQLPLRMVQIQANMRWAIMDIEKKVPAQYIVESESPYVQTAVASACAFLTILPLVIMYLFVQKRFVQGVERSGLGGD